MKRKPLLALVMVTVGFALAMLLLRNPESVAAPESTFICFTNGVPGMIGPAAQFAVRNYPPKAIFPVILSMAYEENGEWKEWQGMKQGAPSMQLTFGGRPEVLITLPAPLTNCPMRYVVQLDRDLGGLRGRVNRLSARLGIFGGMTLFDWRVFFTNETGIKDARR